MANSQLSFATKPVIELYAERRVQCERIHFHAVSDKDPDLHINREGSLICLYKHWSENCP